MNLYILFGQTATGKTASALTLAGSQKGEIVNFDSRHIYKQMSLVTGKDIPPSNTIPHWHYDLVDPNQPFSSAEYCAVTLPLLKRILARGKTPILVGGTGYYLRHLLFGVPKVGVKEDWELRKKLEGASVADLQLRLKKDNGSFLDSMNESDRNNPRRLIRRIEIATHGGTLPIPISPHEILSEQLGIKIIYQPFFHTTQEAAREKIAQRVEARFKQGALDEVKTLLAAGYVKTDPGLNAIGYKQLIGYLEKELTLSEAKKQWTTAEVQYAKRQKTYFKKYFPQPTHDSVSTIR